MGYGWSALAWPLARRGLGVGSAWGRLLRGRACGVRGISRVNELLPHKVLVNRVSAQAKTTKQENHQPEHQKQAGHRGLSLFSVWPQAVASPRQETAEEVQRPPAGRRSRGDGGAGAGRRSGMGDWRVPRSTLGTKACSVPLAEKFAFQQIAHFDRRSQLIGQPPTQELCFPLRKEPRLACSGRSSRRFFCGPPSSS